MLVRVSEAARDAATNGPVQGGDRPDSESDQWFRDIAQGLLGKDAGAQLAIITGLGPSAERSCYRYASGERMPSADFLRLLLWSEQGKQFFDATMDGCEAEWVREYRDLQRKADALAAIVEITKRE